MNIKEQLKAAFNAGLKCNQEHPDDDSYDQVHFERVLKLLDQNTLPPSSPTATSEEGQMEASILKETEEMTLIEWSDPKLGFGRLDFVYRGDGTYTVDAEAMSVKTIIRILKAIGK